MSVEPSATVALRRGLALAWQRLDAVNHRSPQHDQEACALCNPGDEPIYKLNNQE